MAIAINSQHLKLTGSVCQQS